MKSYNQRGAVGRLDPGHGWPFAKWFSWPKPCPENITRQPHRKGLQTRWISAGTGWNVRPPERKAWGGRTCVRGANRRCCLQCQCLVFTSVEHGVWQPGPIPLSWLLQTAPEDSCYPHSPPFYCSSSPLCVTRSIKAEVYFGFLFFNIKRGFPPPT